MSNIPDPTDELNRKTFDAIQWILATMSEGKITEAEAATSLTALWKAVSGLVDESTINQLTQVAQSCQEGTETLTIFQRDTPPITLALIYNHWTQKVKVYNLETKMCVTENQGPNVVAALEAKLLNQNFTKLAFEL